MLSEFSAVMWCSVSWLNCMMLLNESAFGVSVFKEVFKVKWNHWDGMSPSILNSVLVGGTHRAPAMLEHENDSTGTVRSAVYRQAKKRNPTATLGLALGELRSLLL